MSTFNNDTQQEQRKIIYVGGDEEYMGGGGEDHSHVNSINNFQVPTIGGNDGVMNNMPQINNDTYKGNTVGEGHMGGGSEPLTPSITSAPAPVSNEQYGGNVTPNEFNSSTYSPINNNEMFGGAKKKNKTPDSSDDEESDSDNESAASSISTTQLLNVDPVYFRLTKFLTCTDYNGETKNVTNVLNDILTEFKKMNIYLENISKK